MDWETSCLFSKGPSILYLLEVDKYSRHSIRIHQLPSLETWGQAICRAGVCVRAGNTYHGAAEARQSSTQVLKLSHLAFFIWKLEMKDNLTSMARIDLPTQVKKCCRHFG